METERRRQWLLGALAVVLAFVVYRAWPGTSGAPAPASNLRASRTNAMPGAPAPQEGAADIRLRSLDGEWPKPAAGERNLFRFKPKAPPPPPPAPVGAPAMPVATVPSGPPPPPPLPPIPLKCIGVMDREGGAGKVAILSDVIGHVSSGAEGATIDGRYKILRIGAESIEMSYLDGRGRQTIRITGS